MALPFEDEITISSNPFLDILMKNLKVLAYNCIIKDEYEANKKETPYSFSRSEIYIACIENTITLGMFSAADIVIPDEILNAVFTQPSEKDIIKLYKNFGNDISWIPKDVDENKYNPALNQFSRTNYREQLLIRLKTWYLQSYEEQNNYYRMICGLPDLKSWGIPIRDYFHIIPEYIKAKCKGDFLHELDKDIIYELDSFGILDIIRMEYPDEKYLNYISASLDLYEVRKKADLHILWLPPDSVVDPDIKEDFESKYNERRDIVIKTVYSSAFEIENQFYHATMIIYILTMTILDMMAELQIHIIKKDILDRRCVEYLFAQKGVTYYKDIPYQYQQRLCDNLHTLIKYKGSDRDIMLIKSLFGFDSDKDIQLYKYYLMKVRNYDESGNFILDGENKLVTKQNDIVNHYIEFDDFNKNGEKVIEANGESYIKKKIFYPYNNYENKDVSILISLNDKILQRNDNNIEKADYILEKDEFSKYDKYISIKEDILKDDKNVRFDYYVDELVDDILKTNNSNMNIKMVRVNNYSNKHIIPIPDILPFSYNYLTTENKLGVIIGNYWLDKTVKSDKINITVNNGNYNIKINIDDNIRNLYKNNAYRNFNILIYKDKDNTDKKSTYYVLQENGRYTKRSDIIYYDIYEIIKKETNSIMGYEIYNHTKNEKGFFAIKNTAIRTNEDASSISYWILPNSIKESLKEITWDESIEMQKYDIYKNDIVTYYIKRNDDTQKYDTIEDLNKNIRGEARKINVELFDNNEEVLTVIGNYLLTKDINKFSESFIANIASTEIFDKYQSLGYLEEKEMNSDKYYYEVEKNNDYTNLFTLKKSNNNIEIEKYKIGFNFNINNNTLEINGDINLKNKDIYITYFESNEFDIRHCKKEINNEDIIVNDNDDIEIKIPEPFLNYIKNNNIYYITLINITQTENGDFKKITKFINLEKYSIIESENNNILKIDKDDIPEELKKELINSKYDYYNYYKIAFNFIYTANNIIIDFSVKEISFKLSLKYKNQLEFLLQDAEPISNDEEYIKQLNEFKEINSENKMTICAVYIKYNTSTNKSDNKSYKYLIANSDFSYSTTSIMINDNITLEYMKDYNNPPLEISVYYLDKNINEIIYKNINILQQSIKIENTTIVNKDIRLPITNCVLSKDNIKYYETNNLSLILDSYGVHLTEESDYIYGVENGILYIDIKTLENITFNTINITYVYNNVYGNKIIPALIEFKSYDENMEKLVLNSENKEKLQKKILKLESNDSDNNSNKVDLNLKSNSSEYMDIINADKINLCYSDDDKKNTNEKVIENLNSLQVVFTDNIFNSSNIVFDEKVNNKNNIEQEITLRNLSTYLYNSKMTIETIENNKKKLNTYLLMYFLYFYMQNDENNINENLKFTTHTVSINTNTFNTISEQRIEKYVLTDIKNNFVDCPIDYFDNQWPYYITIGVSIVSNTSASIGSESDVISTNNQDSIGPSVDNKIKFIAEILLSENDYDLINGYLYIYNINNIKNNLNNYLDNDNTENKNYYININFIYKIKDNYIYEKYIENYDKNVDLEFCKVPIGENIDITEYLTDTKNWIDYNSFITADSWWIGDKYKNNYYDLIKDQIYKEKFNIVRTKYYSLHQSENYNSYISQSTFFHSMLFDNILLEFIDNNGNTIGNENDMQINVDSLSIYSKFYISHLFLYVICLSYLYSNKTLPYIQHSDNLNPVYIMGFNFNVTLEEVRKELRFKYDIDVPRKEPVLGEDEIETDKKRLVKELYEILNTFNFIDTYSINETTEIKNNYELFERFLLIFNDNMAVYNKICDKILNSDSYYEYKVWSYLYYKLMTCLYDSSYFKIENDTKLAETYEEFLKDKSEILYNNLQSIKNIYDTDTKIDIITQYIEDIEATIKEKLENSIILNEEMDDFYKTIIRIYTGNFTTLRISYMKKILDFFKSYKILIKDINSNIDFNNEKETEENSYRIYEELTFTDFSEIADYYGFNEEIEIKRYESDAIREKYNKDFKKYIENENKEVSAEDTSVDNVYTGLDDPYLDIEHIVI